LRVGRFGTDLRLLARILEHKGLRLLVVLPATIENENLSHFLLWPFARILCRVQ